MSQKKTSSQTQKHKKSMLPSDLIAKRILKCRKEGKLTQEELEEMLNVTPGNGYLSKIERGHKLPSCEDLIRMSKIFRVSTDYILMGDDTESHHPLRLTKDQEDGILTLAESIRTCRNGE